MRQMSLREIRRNLKSKPLRLEELDEFFVETSEARDSELSKRKRIQMILEDEESPVKVLFAGHGGAGKSTELVKFQAENKEQFVFVPLSIWTEGNPSDVNIQSLLVLIVEAVLRKLDELSVPFNDSSIEEIYGWFDEVFEMSKAETKMHGAVETGVDTSGSFLGPLLGLTAKIKAGIRTGTSDVSTRIRREGGKLQQLTYHCRQLLAAAQTAVFKAETSYLVLILEDLDKISLEDADELFIENPALMAQLPIRAIFTAPIYLQYSPKAGRLEGYFHSVIMPMIKVRDQEGNEFAPGVEVIRQILAQRIDLKSSIEPEAVDLAIHKTGGVLRHLFDALVYAAMTAEDKKAVDGDGLPITIAHVNYGLSQVKRNLLNRIGTAFLPEEFGDITTDQLYERLYDFKQGKRAEQDPTNLLLLQAHALIEYNGLGWHRVHPLVEEYLDERKRHTEPSD